MRCGDQKKDRLDDAVFLYTNLLTYVNLDCYCFGGVLAGGLVAGAAGFVPGVVAGRAGLWAVLPAGGAGTPD